MAADLWRELARGCPCRFCKVCGCGSFTVPGAAFDIMPCGSWLWAVCARESALLQRIENKPESQSGKQLASVRDRDSSQQQRNRIYSPQFSISSQTAWRPRSAAVMRAL
jgi:hypothetical protein